MKICCTCQLPKAPKEFCKNSAHPDGVNKQCRSCARESGKKVRLADRLDALIHYGGNPPACACCGESKWEFLSFDHEAGGGKAHLSSIGYNIVRWFKANRYPKGFRVLCHNCNFALGHYGYCPHKRVSDMFTRARAHSRKRGGDRKSYETKTARL